MTTDFTLQPSEVPQPVLFDIDPVDAKPWPMPAGGAVVFEAKRTWRERWDDILDAVSEPFGVGL